jgi:hypothetical protein
MTQLAGSLSAAGTPDRFAELADSRNIFVVGRINPPIELPVQLYPVFNDVFFFVIAFHN